MKVIDQLIFLLINRTAKRAMARVLSERLPADSVHEINTRLWKCYAARVINLGKQKTFGSTVMTRLALLTLIIFEQLAEQGLPDHEAIQLTSKINWILYEKITTKFWIFTRILSRRPMRRVGKAMNFFIKCFPYRKPGYEMEILKSDDTEYAFNVHKCPAAEFFDKHGRSDLCIASWCDLDFPLAKKWGGTLERDKTIARGNSHCNFRFLE